MALAVGATVIGGVMTASALAQPPPAANPVAPGVVIASSSKLDLPDPFLLSSGGKYYMYLSTAFADATKSNVPLIVGTPGHSGPVLDALPNVPSWALPASAGADTWVPDVVQIGGRYVMYFSSQLRYYGNHTHCIGVAVSPLPEGPFVPVGDRPLVCQASLGGDIDAQLFSDPKGPDGPAHPNYLVWKSDNNNLPGSGPPAIWAAPLSDDGLALSGSAVVIFRADRSWEEPIIEAPQMTMAPDGSVWLFFSGGGGYYLSNYAIGVARCDGPLGGCSDERPGPLISSNFQGLGPGEETVFVAPDHSTWLLYSPWHTDTPSALFRPVEAARIGWDAQGPYVAEAGQFPTPS